MFLQCQDDENFYNNACYKKCPQDYKEAGIYCIKSKYYKRQIVEFENQVFSTTEYELYADNLLLQRCQNFGENFVAMGVDYCSHLCP